MLADVTETLFTGSAQVFKKNLRISSTWIMTSYKFELDEDIVSQQVYAYYQKIPLQWRL